MSSKLVFFTRNLGRVLGPFDCPSFDHPSVGTLNIPNFLDLYHLHQGMEDLGAFKMIDGRNLSNTSLITREGRQYPLT